MSPRLTVSLSAILLASVLGAGCAAETSGDSDEDGPIQVGSILDETGPFSVYGEPMALATQMAIEDINANGGVLGRDLELVTYDAQSDTAKYAQFANTAVQRDQVAVLMGGVISSERDAIRQVTDRADVPYFFNQVYEGGLCDGNTVLTGTAPSAQMSVLAPWAVEKFGPKVFVLAADYNYGRISAEWVNHYVEEAGGEVVGTEFLPLATSDFGASMSTIQENQPDIVFSVLVGADHMSFYRQFAASGLAEQSQVVSSTFGPGNEQLVLGADARDVVTAYPYFPVVESPGNEDFLAAWEEAGGEQPPSDPAVTVWNAWHLWAAAAEEAGSVEKDDLMDAIAEGVSYEGPAGTVSVDQSHHVTQDITIARADGEGSFTVEHTAEQVSPAFEEESCDLAENPDTNEQFTP